MFYNLFQFGYSEKFVMQDCYTRHRPSAPNNYRTLCAFVALPMSLHSVQHLMDTADTENTNTSIQASIHSLTQAYC